MYDWHQAVWKAFPNRDPARFHETFTRGLGSAKAFGFGLLMIAPVASTP
jgi:hypothetical protein